MKKWLTVFIIKTILTNCIKTFKNILRHFKRVKKSIVSWHLGYHHQVKKLQYECSMNTIELLIYYQFNYSLKRKITYQNKLQVKQSLALTP